jgi:hypothetical protein
MKRLILVILLLAFPLSAIAMTASDVVITTMVDNRVPVDNVETYPAQLGKLYCFSLIKGATTETSVDHVWLYEGKEMARVTLPVRSAKWRTYSSKRIVPEWKGEWEVRVVGPAGIEMTTVQFKVE